MRDIAHVIMFSLVLLPMVIVAVRVVLVPPAANVSGTRPRTAFNSRSNRTKTSNLKSGMMWTTQYASGHSFAETRSANLTGSSDANLSGTWAANLSRDRVTSKATADEKINESLASALEQRPYEPCRGSLVENCFANCPKPACNCHMPYGWNSMVQCTLVILGRHWNRWRRQSTCGVIVSEPKYCQVEDLSTKLSDVYYRWIKFEDKEGRRRLPQAVANLNIEVHAAQYPRVPVDIRYEQRNDVIKRVFDLLGDTPPAISAMPAPTYYSRLYETKYHAYFQSENQSVREAAEARYQTLPPQLQEVLKNVVLFTLAGLYKDIPLVASPGLLKRYDVVAVTTYAENDGSFKILNKRMFEHRTAEDVFDPSLGSWFTVLHAAAINIGESTKGGWPAEDFVEYSIRGEGQHLDKDKYINDMGKLWQVIFSAASYQAVQDLVLIPFGMGAFLRELKQVDSTYRDPKKPDQDNIYYMRALKSDLVLVMFEKLDKIMPQFQELNFIHICLGFEGLQSAENLRLARQPYKDRMRELTVIHDAFVATAARQREEIRSKLKFYIHKDAFELAQELSESGRTILLNGANKKLLGNHWFADGAFQAIDENLHRRSLPLAATSLLLNDGTVVRNRGPYELSERVKGFGGQVHQVSV